MGRISTCSYSFFSTGLRGTGITKEHHQVPENGIWIVVFDDEKEESYVHDVVLTDQIRGHVGRHIPLPQIYIARKPGVRLGLGKRDVESVELAGGRDVARYI